MRLPERSPVCRVSASSSVLTSTRTAFPWHPAIQVVRPFSRHCSRKARQNRIERVAIQSKLAAVVQEKVASQTAEFLSFRQDIGSLKREINKLKQHIDSVKQGIAKMNQGLRKATRHLNSVTEQQIRAATVDMLGAEYCTPLSAKLLQDLVLLVPDAIVRPKTPSPATLRPRLKLARKLSEELVRQAIPQQLLTSLMLQIQVHKH